MQPFRPEGLHSKAYLNMDVNFPPLGHPLRCNMLHAFFRQSRKWSAHSCLTFAFKRNSFVLTNTGDVVESPANDRERRVQRGQGPQEGNIAEGRVLGPKLLATPHSSDVILVRSHLTSLIVYVLTGVMEMPPTTFKGLL